MTDPGRLQGDLVLIKIERLRQEIGAENRRFVWQIIVALVLTFAAGAAAGHVLWR
jgi:hypothetical protein